MLVLSLDINHRIVIGENITIDLVSIRNDETKLGITAPNDILILRSELLDRNQGKFIKGRRKSSNN